MNIKTALAPHLKSMEPVFTRDLRAAARKAGWPASITRSLSVVISGTSINVVYPEAVKEQVENLEYGTPDVSPKPIFRTFTTKHENLIAQTVAEGTLNHLFATGVLP